MENNPTGEDGNGANLERMTKCSRFSYFQYVNVPAHKEYEFGWNRGNPHHYISRYEQAKDHRFRTRVRPRSNFCRNFYQES